MQNLWFIFKTEVSVGHWTGLCIGENAQSGPRVSLV